MGIPELPLDLNHISRRRAEVIVHQLVCGSFSGVRAFYPPDASDHDTTCHMCTLSVPETVEHALLRCTGRSSSRRKLFGFLQRKESNIPFLCRNSPINTLNFVDNEGLIKSPQSTLISRNKEEEEKQPRSVHQTKTKINISNKLLGLTCILIHFSANPFFCIFIAIRCISLQDFAKDITLHF